MITIRAVAGRGTCFSCRGVYRDLSEVKIHKTGQCLKVCDACLPHLVGINETDWHKQVERVAAEIGDYGHY